MARKIIVGDQEFIIPDKFPKSGLSIGLLLVALFAVWSSVYRVELEEEGVLMTLGEYSGLVQSGIHLKWPAPIQTVIKIPTKRKTRERWSGGIDCSSREQVGRHSLWRATPRHPRVAPKTSLDVGTVLCGSQSFICPVTARSDDERRKRYSSGVGCQKKKKKIYIYIYIYI